MSERYKCKICDKDFASMSSRSNHIKRIHKTNNKDVVKNVVKNVVEVKDVVKNVVKNVVEIKDVVKNENNVCKFCNKSLSDRISRWKHEQKCKEKIDQINDDKDTKIKALEEKMDQMMELLKSMKIHPKTLQKINNQLNNNTTNNGTINNITNNNLIIPISEQYLKDVLKKSEKLEVLKDSNKPHIRLINILYKKPQYEKYRNVYITNLSNDVGYIYDQKENRFIVKPKKEILEEYGEERFSDIQAFYEELENKIDSKSLNKLKALVESYFDGGDFKDERNKELLISLYNNKLNVRSIVKQVNDVEI
jgi:hypothetical protein